VRTERPEAIQRQLEPRLTPKRARFVEEYLVDLNGTQAAIRAGYSPKTANEQAARLLAKVHISNAVAERQKQLADQAHVTQETVIAGLLKEARFDGPGTSHGARVSAWTQLGWLTS
jgi:phage terminase small subunit